MNASLRILSLTLPCLLLTACPSTSVAEPVRVIFDTDMDTDCDDAGALAILHALADRGEAVILATPVSSKYPYSVACTEAINRYYGRGDLPIGSPKGEGAGIERGSRYAKQIAREFETLAMKREQAPDAVDVYRRVLASEADSSVTVVTVGYLTNLRDLLASPADDISPLSGTDLVRKKVRRWICMGGRYPRHLDRRVFGNFKPDPKSAVTVVRDWPTPVIFSGLATTAEFRTGQPLVDTPKDNPVRRAYELFLGEKITEGRASPDPITILYAIRPDADNWRLRHDGYNHIFPAGTNEWRLEPNNPNHAYLLLHNDAIEEVVKTMNDLMTVPPKHGGK